jgi:hypothetical protein
MLHGFDDFAVVAMANQKVFLTTEPKMQNAEYFDLIDVLHECRNLISEAYSRGLPTGMFGKENAEKIEKLMNLTVLDRASPTSIQLCKRFRSVLDEVAARRHADQLSVEDIKCLADRYSEWCRVD